MTPLDEVLLPLAALARATIRVWRLEGNHWQLVAGPDSAAPRAPRGGSEDASWTAFPDLPGLFLEVSPEAGGQVDEITTRVLPIVRMLLAGEEAATNLTSELAARYEEIDLLYTIGELLGHAHPVAEIAQVILREVTAVVGARRAGLRVYDEVEGVLRSVATIGTAPGEIPETVAIDDRSIVVVRAFQSQRIETGVQPTWVPGDVLAVPIKYSAANAPDKVVGTLALADRAGGGAFTQEETKLVVAVATQIGAALENSRLAELERQSQRLEREIELAHDLQLRLMPTPAVLQGEAEVSVTSTAAETLGGDFYTFTRLGRGRVGVMLGDVSSNGFAAALIAAQVIAMAGVHVNAATQPDETLEGLRTGLGPELSSAEMFLTLFYGVLDPNAGRLVYTNAGHAHAFRVPRFGPSERLDATSPPLGLHEAGSFGRAVVPWRFSQDLLVLFTDGFVDQPSLEGIRFGEERMLAIVEEWRDLPADALKQEVLDVITAWGGAPVDDQTLVILRM